MAESEYTQRDVASIRTELELIKSMQRILVASSKDVQEHIRVLLISRDHAPEVIVFLGEGPKLQSEIRAILNKSEATTSKVLSYLHGHGVIVPLRESKSKRWMLTPMESAVRIVGLANGIIRERAKAKA